MAALAITAACAKDPVPDTAFRIEPPVAESTAEPQVPLFTVRLTGAEDAAHRVPAQETTVADPVYKRDQTYESVSFADLIEAGKPADVVLTGNTRLVFQTSDGYRSITSMEVVRAFGARLALRDVNAAAGQSWRPIPGRPAMTPAPYYLVWPSANADLPWPYAVTAVEVWTTEPVDLTRPDADPAANAGHAIFKKRCGSCHSVNGAGGAVGPELNVPANVTEYWNRAALKQFILNPASIRRDVKMPPPAGLSEADVDAVIAYLVKMKTLKRAPAR